MDQTWHIAILRPGWLAGLAVLPLVFYFFRRSLVHDAPRRRKAALGMRIALVVLAVLALAGIELSTRAARQMVVFAVDQSQSIGDEGQRQSHAFLDAIAASAGGNDTALVPFAAAPGPAMRMGAAEAELDRGGTDVAAALMAARAAIPPNCVGHIVLLSDGNATRGDALASAKATGVPVSVVGLSGCPADEVYVAAVRTPGEVREGAPFEVEAVIVAARPTSATVRLGRGSEEVARREVQLQSGENRVLFEQVLIGRPAEVFWARVEGCPDTLAENNEAKGMVFCRPRPRVLLVESRPVLAAPLAAALKAEHIDVEVRSPEEMPGRLEELRTYPLLVLSNVPATSLSADRMALIGQFVRETGGGLIAVGGDQSFTPGGYRNTPLEAVLPVVSEARKEKPKPRLAMVLVIDRSASMKGESIELARQATRQAVNMLGPQDQVGVIAFEDQSRWVSPIRPSSDKSEVLRQIDTITAEGGTNMLPALERAELALAEAYADLKHILLMTDGLSHPGDFESLTRSIAAQGITVSTVGVGPEVAQALLKDIADRGRGHFYFCPDAAAIPRVFAMETIRAGKVGITEEPFFPKATDTAGLLKGVDLEHVPTLLGYVETQARPESQVVLTSQAGDPLLACWRVGEGTSVAFTSDIQSRWAAAWLRWPGFGKFWARLVRHAMRPDLTKGFEIRTEYIGGRIDVVLEAADAQGRYLNGADAVTRVTDPQGKERQMRLDQTAPGRYGTAIDAPAKGPYCLETELKYGGRPVYSARRGVVVGYPDELRVRPADESGLRRIAEATGGAYGAEPAAAFSPTDERAPQTFRFWPYLLGLALLVLVADVAARRPGAQGFHS